ncbi:MAG: FG-GAP-like repeat-containing protein [Vicinamibacteria bacterium]
MLWAFAPLPPRASQDTGSSQSHRNLGKGYYEQGKYDQAAAEFLEVLKLGDGTARDHFNAGMALLQSGDYDRALGSFTTAKQIDPDLPAVDFGLGVLHKRLQRYPDALRALQRVAARDPDDPCTWFNIGAVYFSMNRVDEAAHAFGKVLAMGFPTAQNFYVSSLFRQATLLMRQGKPDEARTLFAEFQPLRERVPSVSLTPSALENGRHSEIKIPIPRDPGAPSPPVATAFSQTGIIRFAESPCTEPPAVAMGDYDGDGRTDLFFSNPCGPSRLFRNEGRGDFTDVTAAVGLGEPLASVAAAFIDYENQGFPSLLVLGEKTSRLFLNREGRFTDASAGSGLWEIAVRRGSNAVVFDFDNDGQLDLFLTGMNGGDRSASRVYLYRNGADGSFTDVSTKVGLRSIVSSDWRTADFADFDNDGFSDLLLVGPGSSALLLRNHNGERFQGFPVALGSRTRGGESPRIQIEDFDRDGWFDVLVSGDGGYTVLFNRKGERLETASNLPLLAPHARGGGILIDADADGWSDVLFQDRSGGFHLLGSRRLETLPLDFDGSEVGRLAAADLDPDGSVHLVVAGTDGIARLFERTSPARPTWMSVDLKGDKSNRQGVGAILEVKAGNFYQKRVSTGPPITIYTSGRETVDVLRVTWPNAVIQNELEVAANRAMVIVESDRQTSSCPFLYVWDGTGYRFLTDVVGRAPLGERLPSGSLLQPNPDDYVRIPPALMKARDGRYVFQLTEELREIAYVDALELLVVDHEIGTEVFTNERFSSPPFDDFRLYAIGSRHAPISAEDHFGRDVLPLVSRRDNLHTPSERGRVPGIVREHALIVDPGDLDGAKTVRLFLSGWVYWVNSSAMRALTSNTRVAFHPPELQVKDREGRWVTVIEDLGLPSGINRTLVADLTDKFLTDDYSVRIVTNLDVHWDEAFFSTGGEEESVVVQRLAPADADLHYRGFSEVVRERGGSTPDFFDYSRLMETAPWNAAGGLYSNYGDVLGLIETTDSRQALMAPGDEMTVSFDGRSLSGLSPGWQRDFVLRIAGWAKDNEPTTLFFDTVEPLPFRGMTQYGARSSAHHRREHHARRVPLLIPPLAPVH